MRHDSQMSPVPQDPRRSPRNPSRRINVTQQRLRLNQPVPQQPVRHGFWRRLIMGVRRFLVNFVSWDGWSKVASIATAGAAVTALWFSGQSLRANDAQYGLSEQGQVTDRFTKAVENLGSDKLDVRIGGIYSLERLSRDSRGDRPTILDVLSAYVRGQAPAPPEWVDDSQSSSDGTTPVPAVHCPVDEKAPLAIDIQAVATVITRRDLTIPDERPIDLSHSCLHRVNLAGIQLQEADLTGTDLTHADFMNVEAFGPKHRVRDINLNYAHLDLANLSNVFAVGATAAEATMYGTSLAHAVLPGIDLTKANLWQADLSNADIRNAILDGADLRGANLAGTNLTGITYGSSTQWPEGFTPPPSSPRPKGPITYSG
jgi:uncharacterized protein YjbI with pentapeptide repeats